MNQPSGRRARRHRTSHPGVSSPIVVMLSRQAMVRIGVSAAALALIVLPAVALLASGGTVGSPSLVDQQLDGIVQAGNTAPTTEPVFIPAEDMPLPLSSGSGIGGQPTAVLKVLGPGGAAVAIARSAFFSGSSLGIPLTVLAAYHHAAEVLASTDPHCGLPWWVLAGIGRIESGHAAGGHVDGNGTTLGRIVGPRLDGSTPGTGVVLDTDHGILDGDPIFDRAVGPMQFLPSTWASVVSDGNGDGRMDPNNIYDATLGAARYLCANRANLATDVGLTAAVTRYNHSAAYVDEVISWGRAYRDGVTPVADSAGPIPTAKPDSPPSRARPAAPTRPVGPARPDLSGPPASRHTGDAPSTPPLAPTPSPVTTGSSGTSGTTTPNTSTTTPGPTCTPTTGPTTSRAPLSTATPPPTSTSSQTTASTTSAFSPPMSGPTPAC